MWWNINLRVRFFKSLLMVLNGSFHGEFYADSVSIRKSNLKMQNVEKTNFHKHIKPVKLSRQTLFFGSGVTYNNIYVKKT